MKRSISTPRLRFLRNGFTVLLLASAGCSIGAGAPGSPRVPGLAQTLPMSETIDTEQPACTSSVPTQSLSLSGPQGQRIYLAHFQGCGWKYITARPAGCTQPAGCDGKPGFRTASFSTAPPPTVPPALTPRDPMALFIDGPTGYAFAWTHEGGWKFVGQIANAGQ